ACRKHACLNSNAQMKKPVTIEDHQNSPMVIDPFHLLDICLVSDGGAAVLVTSAETAGSLKSKPVFISGVGEGHNAYHLDNAVSLTEFEGTKNSAKNALKMAGLELGDIDLAEIYDCFTYTMLVQLEDYGFCRKGEGGAFVENGRIELGGDLPVNTHGGLLSQAHLDGMAHITEAVKQLRGVCGDRQVKDAEVALVTGNGGHFFTSHSTLLLRR
ncbi:MAG: thiolase family protein, partial [Thermodesulfobacteriota bacterium]|nr:thiolase family protein [Thermodesulfobacteriota bacterium]